LKKELDTARAQVRRARADTVDVQERTAAALAYARDHRLAPRQDDRTERPYGSPPEEWSP
jgi:hypothetical protein